MGEKDSIDYQKEIQYIEKFFKGKYSDYCSYLTERIEKDLKKLRLEQGENFAWAIEWIDLGSESLMNLVNEVGKKGLKDLEDYLKKVEDS